MTLMAPPADPFEITDDPVPAPNTPERRPVASMAHLEGLNDEQRKAVIHEDGPLLVLAGAGTGKTRVLTTRIAHLLITGRTRPSQVLAVTFTNKAAREMLDRVAQLIGGAADGMWLGTFHSVGVRILRRHAELVGLKSNFTILDTDDQTRLLKQLLQAEGIDDKKWPARVLSGIIQRWKDRALTPNKVTGEDAGEFANGKAAEIYRQYQTRLAEVNAVDFGDLVMLCVTLWQQHPDVLEQYHRRFRHILVDEYQDTNVAQYLWLRLLAQGTRDVCCVGDDDQSIYGWRGAEVGNILRFEKDFPGAEIVRLERNYRSTPHILAAASHLIAHNEGRLGKTLWTDVKEGERISVRGVWDGDEEARTIGEEIEALQRDKHPLSQIAILVRAGFQTREFEERFITLGLPYRVIGGPRFYERQEIRDALAYCRVTVQPDDDLAFERIYNTPRRGLGESALRTLRLIQRAQRVSLFEAARRALETDELKPRPRKLLGDLIKSFERWRDMLDGINHVEVVETMLDESGYTDMLRADRSPEAEGRLENLKELTNALQEFDTLPAFLEHVALLTDNAEKAGGDMVSVMTLHAAKGLEFDTVFLPGWEEGLFPNQRALDDKGLAGLEEERRLAYVGLTRARKRAYVSFAANRRVFNQWQAAIPSRFLRELPTGHLAESSDAGLYATYSAGHHAGLREQASGFDYENLGVTGRSAFGGNRSRTRWRDETFDDRRAVEGDKPDLTVGQRVFHQKFGYGRILAVDGNKLDIDFEKAGPKKVLDSFVDAA
ncbi:DNA helicase-2 / ATP-dependent DNA helicase PcrA [Enhydrobacter aerosaccus]|uniref:DNA 3'-5' helicase n=1 Tax=Enhydrobacter aerosaccus TaxID=225324 RepID=A0A1T4JPY4_9HYPH|nr:UvrD-helicase domain-containing protein [Enhydrobacter aerosaccus]SJZ32260.1 DNA helicase-2 / ATP-dependent DNA helicase PcrA [Enhydrobacter aerosaccus]